MLPQPLGPMPPPSWPASMTRGSTRGRLGSTAPASATPTSSGRCRTRRARMAA
jgi:hypothetical protein